MSSSRRGFLKTGVAAAALSPFARGAAAGLTAPTTLTAEESRMPWPPGLPHRDYRPVVTPDLETLPFKIVDEVKVFHLIAEEVEHEFAVGLEGRCWGYNGSTHGPTIEAVEGDRVRIYVTNRLPGGATTTVHWHGLRIPSGMDGVGGLTQRPIEPGETFRYEFTLRQHGTYMYHSHHDEMTQMAMGMMGMFVIHPRHPSEPAPDRDYAYMLSEWMIKPGMRRPDPNEMSDFNIITLNARVFPDTAPLVAKLGERVRIRFGNLSAMSHHPIHLHGTAFQVTETDGGVIPPGARWPETTVLVPVGSTRTVDFVADNPGDWAMHCHMTHHIMNQMGHGIPNLIGVDPGDFDEAIARMIPEHTVMAPMGAAGMAEDDEDIPANSIPMLGGPGAFGYVTMGGMFTILKVRETLEDGEDPGWYTNPPGTVADAATPDDMRRDGIDG